MKTLILLMLISFAAPAQTIDELSSYFRKDAEEHQVKLDTFPKIVTITNLYMKYGYEGKSNHKNGKWTVQLDYELIKSDYGQALLYHELGHALLGRADTKDKSLMNPDYFTVLPGSKKWDALVVELFDKSKFNQIKLDD